MTIMSARQFRWQLKLYLSLLIISIFFLTGCSNTTLSSEMPNILKSDAININNDWTGLSPIAPIKAHYYLQLKESAFRGTAQFSVAGYKKNGPRKASADIKVPIDEVRSFLKTLAHMSLREGHYKPKIEWTDDYPSIKIEIRVKEHKVVIFSKSQDNGNVPWGIRIEGKTYITDTNTPAKALEKIEPYLKNNVLEKLKKQEDTWR